MLDRWAMVVLVVLCASWGLNQVAIKVAVTDVPPLLQAGLRSIGATVLLLLWMRFRGQRIFEKDGSLGWGILVGVLFSMEFVLIFWGLMLTHASRSAIFLYTAPFVVALGAHWFIRSETLNRVQIIGMVLAFCGLILAFGESMTLPDRKMLTGDLMLLAAAVFWGSVTVMIKATPLSRISPAKNLLYQLGISAILLPLGSLALGEPAVRMHVGTLVLVSMAYQTIWVAFVTYVSWFWLIRTYPVSRISPFTFLTPLFGVLAGGMLLGEPLTSMLLGALVLVGSGIYLVNRK